MLVAQQFRRFSINAKLVEFRPVLTHTFFAFALFPSLKRFPVANKLVERNTKAAGFENRIYVKIDDLS